MAAGGWLSGIGAALQQGTQDYRKGKIYDEEKARQAQLDARDAERDRVQMALMQSQETRAGRAEARAEELMQRDLVKEALLMGGPEQAIDSDLASRAKKTGLGHMVGSRGVQDGVAGQRFTLDPNAGAEAGFEANLVQQAAPTEQFRKATFAESEALADRKLKTDAKSQQDLALQGVTSSKFDTLAPSSRNQLWQLAGFSGPAPESKEERLYWANLKHKQDMQQTAAQAAAYAGRTNAKPELSYTDYAAIEAALYQREQATTLTPDGKPAPLSPAQEQQIQREAMAEYERRQKMFGSDGKSTFNPAAGAAPQDPNERAKDRIAAWQLRQTQGQK